MTTKIDYKDFVMWMVDFLKPGHRMKMTKIVGIIMKKYEVSRAIAYNWLQKLVDGRFFAIGARKRFLTMNVKCSECGRKYMVITCVY